MQISKRGRGIRHHDTSGRWMSAHNDSLRPAVCVGVRKHYNNMYALLKDMQTAVLIVPAITYKPV